MPPDPLPVLSADLLRDLRRLNPWWEGRPSVALPLTRRHLVRQIESRLSRRLAPIVVVRGPRQIGKTTAQMQVLDSLLATGVTGNRILRLQADELPALSRLEEPILRVVDWFEAHILGRTLNEAARVGESTYLFFDEVQNLSDWAPQLKFLVDQTTTQVVVTGSSALRIEQGRDSLAGRISSIEAGVLSLTEIAAFRGIDLGSPFLRDNGLSQLVEPEFWRALREHGRALQSPRDETFGHFAARGGYPLVHQAVDATWPELADQLNETVIRRVIQHDLRVGERGRKRDASLLEELFRLACRYVGQSPGPRRLADEVRNQLGADLGTQRVRHYMRFLNDTLLLRLIEPLELRLKKRRSAPKICLADHGLRASWLQEVVPLEPAVLVREPHLSTLAGHLAESVVGSCLSTISQLDIAHFPERSSLEPEIDFVLTIGTRRIPLEVKYQRSLKSGDATGLRSFLEKPANNAPFGVLVCQDDSQELRDPRIITLPLSSFLLLR